MSTRTYRKALVVLCTAAIAACGSQEDRAQSFLQRGTELFEQGEFVKARLELKNGLQIDPKEAQAWFLLAKIAEQREEWRAAYSAYGKTVELDPQNWEARVERGSLALAGNQAEEALDQAEAVLAARPQDPAARALRGSVHLRQGDLDAAGADAQAALEQAPEHRDALALLARIRIEQEDFAGAKEVLEVALRAHPEDLALLLAAAGINQQLGDSAGTEAMLQRVIAREPTELEHRTRLAQYLNARGDTDAAELALRGAVTDMPESNEPKLVLASLIGANQGIEAAAAELATLVDAEPENHELRFTLASSHMQTGDLAKAQAAYREIIERAGDTPEALRARAKLAALLLAQERPDEASALAAEVLAADPENSDALLVRAAIALQDGDPDQAIGDLRTVSRNQPDSVAALSLLSQAHAAKDAFTLAEDALEQVIEVAPEQPSGYLQLAALRARIGDLEGAALVLEELLARDPDSAAALTALAQIRQRQPDTDALDETAGQVLASRPDHPLGHYLKGLALQRRGQLEASITQFETALEKEADAAQPLVALARSYLALEQPEKAVDRLRRVLAANPSNAVAINLLGEVYVAAGRLPEARAQYEEAISQRPGAPLAYERLARLQLNDGDTAGAIATLETGIEATRRSPLLVTTLPLVLEAAERYEEAISAYEEILAADPGADWAANNLAMLLANQRADDASSLERALILAQRFADSEQAPFLDTLGWVYYRNGDYQRATEVLERMQATGEMTPERQFHLGMTYLLGGRPGEARPLLVSAVAADQPFAGIDEAREALGSIE